jgi:hypothetical protein
MAAFPRSLLHPEGPMNVPLPSVRKRAARVARCRTFRLAFAAALGCAPALCSFGCQHAPRGLWQDPPRPRREAEVTFLVTADTHFGAANLGAANLRQIQAMNDLPGTPFPSALGGRVQRPSATLIAGDLTDFGTGAQWQEYQSYYGPGGLLGYAVFECSGNHDRYQPFETPVLDGIEARHGEVLYSVALGPLIVMSLDLYPSEPARRWLGHQLESIGSEVPVVLFFHYPLAGHFADAWSDAEKADFVRVIRSHNIVALFHGHRHDSQHYVWRGYDVFNVGSPRHSYHSFAVVRATPRELTVASWDWEYGWWEWSHTKSIGGSQHLGDASDSRRAR